MTIKMGGDRIYIRTATRDGLLRWSLDKGQKIPTWPQDSWTKLAKLYPRFLLMSLHFQDRQPLRAWERSQWGQGMKSGLWNGKGGLLSLLLAHSPECRVHLAPMRYAWASQSYTQEGTGVWTETGFKEEIPVFEYSWSEFHGGGEHWA